MTLTIDTNAGHVRRLPSPVALIPSSSVAHPDRDIAQRRLIRVRRGVLAPAAAWSALAPWDRYLARVHAVNMTHPGAVFCLESAAALLGAPIFGEPRDVHILETPGATSRLSGGIRLHTTAGDRLIVDAGGVLVTSLLDVAIDIARSRHGAIALAVADGVLRLDTRLTVEALVAQNEARLSKRGRRLARWSLHRASPLAETPLESVSRAAVEWLGFDAPVLQREFVTGGTLDRSDMWWEDQRVIGESDGDVKYDGSLKPAVDAIRREKDRDRRLLRHADGIAHWGWSDLMHVTPLRTSLLQAGLRPRYAESSRDLFAMTAVLGRPRS
jgi:hypothetical protein